MSTTTIDRITPALRKAIYDDWGKKCAYCAQKPPEEIDHIFPASAGGEDRLENYAPTCKGCNRMKTNLVFAEGFLHIVLAKAKRKAPRIRKKLALSGRTMTAYHMIDDLVSKVLKTRYSRAEWDALPTAEQVALRAKVTKEVEPTMVGWSVPDVYAEYRRLKAFERDWDSPMLRALAALATAQKPKRSKKTLSVF